MCKGQTIINFFVFLTLITTILASLNSITNTNQLFVNGDSRGTNVLVSDTETNVSPVSKIATNNPVVATLNYNTTVTRDKTTYIPGENVTFAITSDYNTFNGTVRSWKLSNPLGKVVMYANSTSSTNLPLTINNTLYEGSFNQSWEGQMIFHYYKLQNTSYQVFFNITCTLPLYPALLGAWRFELNITNTNTVNHIWNYGNDGSNNVLEFTVTDTLNYFKIDTFARRGSNSTQVFYENESTLAVLSPGDNITYISQYKYNSSIARLNTTTTAVTADLNLNQLNGAVVKNNIGILRTVNENMTDIAHGKMPAGKNTSLYSILNFQIPMNKSLYGNYTLQLKMKFTASNHIVTCNIANITIKYRVLVAEVYSYNQKTNFSLTETVTGYVRFAAVHWLQLNQTYPNNNISVYLPISAADLDLKFYANYVSNASAEIVEMFEKVFADNNTYYWRARMLLSYNLTNYQLGFRWSLALNYGDTVIGNLRSAQDRVNEYKWNFTLSASYRVTYQQTKITQGTAAAVMRFKLAFAVTNQTVYEARAIIVEKGTTALSYTYDNFTAEYVVDVSTLLTTTGLQTFTVRFADGTPLVTDTIEFTVTPVVPFTEQTTAPLTQEKAMELVDFAFLGIFVVVALGFAAAALFFGKFK